MEIRNTSLKDLHKVMQIYKITRRNMIKNNNPSQWGKRFPKRSWIKKDIKDNNSYVIINEGRLVGVFSLIFGSDPTYTNIEGKWINDLPYATIHRIASDSTTNNILITALDFSFSKINNIRIDTHKYNKIMIHLLKKYGFTYCGIIYVRNHSPRLAFQKII